MNRIWLMLVLWCFISCDSSLTEQGKDAFYTDKGGFDMARIPLIKPYEARTPSTNPNWIVQSIDTNSVPLTIPGAKEIIVIDSVILLRSTNTTLNYQPVKEGWFIIIPKNKILKGFTDHEEYLRYLNFIGIKAEPKLHHIEHVYRYFDDFGHIDWREIR